MIQAITNTNFTVYIQTEDNRIDTSVSSSNIKHLVKFTNDISGEVQYAYAATETIFKRYTRLEFNYNAVPDVFLGRVDLKPAGYWKYEAFEVSFQSFSALSSSLAPSTENAVLLPASATRGVVQGLVTKGKMFVSEQSGTEEVQYSQNGGQLISLTIAYGGAGYGVAPALTIVGDSITTATATCTVLAGSINTVTIVTAGNGYSENPTVTLASVGETATASITASIQQDNYIYTG
tara:strand:+ start:1926 stop:2630 length:705 start_codon:yes stop_codon:yes gene_type:complete